MMDLGELSESTDEPGCDIIECHKCQGKYEIGDCPTEQDGDWEGGYYTIHTCPKCECGGEPEYTMSMEQADKWSKWNANK
jgi:hypothetical protein